MLESILSLSLCVRARARVRARVCVCVFMVCLCLQVSQNSKAIPCDSYSSLPSGPWLWSKEFFLYMCLHRNSFAVDMESKLLL